MVTALVWVGGSPGFQPLMNADGRGSSYDQRRTLEPFSTSRWL